MKICVFLAHKDLAGPYVEATRKLALLLAARGHTLVWGGCDAGLMKVVADHVVAGGGRLVGVTVPFLEHKTRPGIDEMYVAGDLAERKALMLHHADAVVAMAGGLGTLDEVTEVLELKKHGMHDKPVVLLNTAGFYEGLMTQLRRMEAEGFLPLPLDELVYSTPEEQAALDHLEARTRFSAPAA
ncbi:TIGR00730 family Rossman fold protein [Streptomyces cyaneofuscatus]|uniref:LOG family protein n=1 Tax=Streptomyces cyaneofuscatus TaxID=66883 RepID=UPI0033B2FFE2